MPPSHGRELNRYQTWSGMTEIPTRAPALVPASHMRIGTPASTPHAGTTTPILAPRAQLGMPHANIGSPVSPLGTSAGTPEPAPRAGVFTPARALRMGTNSPAPAPPAHIFAATSPTTISDIGPQEHSDMFAPAPRADISVPVLASGAGLGTLRARLDDQVWPLAARKIAGQGRARPQTIGYSGFARPARVWMPRRRSEA
jgi:hypothetical protein